MQEGLTTAGGPLTITSPLNTPQGPLHTVIDTRYTAQNLAVPPRREDEMHASQKDHLQLCIDTYLREDRHYDIMDFGSRVAPNPSATHQDLLAKVEYSMIGVDILPGPGVDVVMPKPYSIPLKSNCMDVIISGSTFEHVPFFWVSFLEMCRVLRPGGLLFVTAPSRGHVHGVQDPWRFYPDGMRALAAFGRMNLREAHTDLPPRLPQSRRFNYAGINTRNAYWGDSIGVFQKPKRYSYAVRLALLSSKWWANRVGGLDVVPKPDPLPARRSITGSRS